MPFQKGRARTGGRAKGTPNHSTADIKAMAFKHCPEALEFLVKTMHSPMEPTPTKIAAAKELLDRGVGKAAQPQTGEGGEGPAKVEYIFNWQK